MMDSPYGGVTKVARWLPKIGFGLVLAGYGVNHYRNIDAFVGMSQGVYPTMPALGSLAGVLAYIFPLLMIVGGVLFAIGQLCWLSKSCILAALAGILGWAGLAVLVGDGATSGNMMPMIQNAAVLLILYYVIKKMCCKSCCSMSCGCPSGACTCPPDQSGCGCCK